MAKRTVSYRLSDTTYYSLKNMQEETGYTQTELVEMAVRFLFYSDAYNRVKEHENKLGLSLDGNRVELVGAAMTYDVRYYVNDAMDKKLSEWLRFSGKEASKV